MKDLKFLAGVVVGLAIAGVIVVIVLHKNARDAEDQLPPGVALHDPTPAENAAARAALIEKIKTDRDPQWLKKWGCLEYTTENREMAEAAHILHRTFDPPPTCHALNPLAPADL